MTSRFTPDQVQGQLERIQSVAALLDRDMHSPGGEPTDRAICRYLDLILATNMIIVNAVLSDKGVDSSDV